MDITTKFLFSFSMILFFGFLIGYIFSKIKIPKIIGMILVGILFGPSVLNILDESLLNISGALRQVALVIILTRAGLSLNLDNLKKIGRPAILMCFVPATLEIIGTTIFAPLLLDLSITEALLLGSVLAAVSPAVVVPMMIKLKEEHYGENHNIPELIMAGSSCDDVFVIVLFYSFLGLAQNQNFDYLKMIQIPTSIILGIVLGIFLGLILAFLFTKIKINKAVKVIITLSLSFFLLFVESSLKQVLSGYLSISALLSIMVFSIIINKKNEKEALDIKSAYDGLWVVFEIILFTLVGAKLDFSVMSECVLKTVLLIFIILIFRSLGVLLCLIKTKLTFKERIFAIIAYLPKATVQASIGGIALEVGLECGSLILAISILSILITAPIGSIGMNLTYKKLLTESNKKLEGV